jgi:chromosome segregation ATPase
MDSDLPCRGLRYSAATLPERLDAKVTAKDVEEIGKRLDAGLAGLEKQFTAVRTGFADMRAEFGTMRADFTAMRTEVEQQFAAVRAEMAEQFTAVRGEIGELRTEVDRVAIETRSSGVKLDDLHGQIRIVGDGVALANERIDGVDIRIDKLTSEVRRNAATTRIDIGRLQEAQQRLEDGQDQLRQRVERLA